ncbi:MAG: hypothetical protein LBV74_08390 [Tannerella sp.]|jgi:hypothetical protein|nr:hypothetical protein [Tannerella sp.]
MSFYLFSGIFILGVVVFISYSFSKWVLKKLKISNKKNRKYIAVLPTIVLIPIILIIGIYSFFLFIDLFENSGSYTYASFNEYAWNKYPSRRIDMVHDIIESKLLKGKTKSEVVEILGSDYRRYDENTIIYNLEKYTWYFVNAPKVLKIHFWSGRVMKAETNHKSNKVTIPDTEAIDELNIVTECEVVQHEQEEISTGIEVFTK